MTFSAPSPLYAARPRAIVFDLDGTLVDTALDLGGALNRLLAEYSRPAVTLNDIRHMVGDGAAKLVERGFLATGGLPLPLPDMTKRFIELYGAGIADESVTFPGVVETLERCSDAGIGLGVCTNKPLGLTRALLDKLDLSRFFAAVAGGDGPVRKPDPRHILGVLETAARHAGEFVDGRRFDQRRRGGARRRHESGDRQLRLHDRAGGRARAATG